MKSLTLDDLLSLEEFVSRLRELFEAQRRYVDRYRRIRIGPKATLIFENRQTLWFRVQDILRVARMSDPQLIQAELNVYNQFLPKRDSLQGALMIDIKENLIEELKPWQNFTGENILMHVGECEVSARLITSRLEDRVIGSSHWLQFDIDSDARARLMDDAQRLTFEITLESYSHQSTPVGNDVRQSLLDDLTLSDRAA